MTVPASDLAGRKSHVVYVVSQRANDAECIALSLTRLAARATTVGVVCDPSAMPMLAGLADLPENVTVTPAPDPVQSSLMGYRYGLLALREAGEPWPAVLLAGSHFLGPVAGRLPEPPDGRTDSPGLSAPCWRDLRLDPRTKQMVPDSDTGSRCPELDFTWIGPELLADPGFWTLWDNLRETGDYLTESSRIGIGLVNLARSLGREIQYPMPRDAVATSDPIVIELDSAIAAGAWCLPLQVLNLDPLLHDLHATDIRAVIEWLRANDPELCQAFTGYAARNVPLRDFTTIADQYEVFTDTPADPEKSEWAFGTVAVFIHAFYAEMMPDFWQLISRLPCANDLFITTASEADATSIRDFLTGKGRPTDSFEVRVVEQNRGRDMSSLFITWRDVALSDRYEVALRLHSKRTPQVSRQVGNSFRDHLFDNLVHSRGHVANILDRLEAEPDIGLAVPPVIHIGFGTLGHSWWNNKEQVDKLGKRIGLNVPLDHDTPVTAYGTMYWFRPKALRKMFAHPWRWEQYNPEPHHIDGGLAHVQERLIGYCVPDAGYRVLQVLTPKTAARGYARLEYKLQMMSAYLSSNVITDQRYELAQTRMSIRGRTYRRMRNVYGQMLRRFPGSRQYLRPFKQAVVRVLMGRTQF